ncbi:hypothetical protein DYBT9275_00146 [Dyadobacter sp. CECT 9275]|uniref:Uncharacterized protein n=1 Tax=Dyadobacter helix TaxID=2822344 RepID=A0A916J7T8_9BACT|nr:hypothetical protein DYBT9275_00146 [Dyadobacter sp. CECT 9275]
MRRYIQEKLKLGYIASYLGIGHRSISAGFGISMDNLRRSFTGNIVQFGYAAGELPGRYQF